MTSLFKSSVVGLSFLTFCSPSNLLAQAKPPAPPAKAPAAAAAEIDITKDTNDLGLIFREGLNAYGKKDYSTAIEKMSTFIKRANGQGDQDTAHFTLAASYYLADDFDKSVTAFKEYQTKFPAGRFLNDSKKGVGQALLKLNKKDEGVAALKEAAAIPALRDEVGLILATFYKEENKPEEAIQVLQGVIRDGIKTSMQADAGMYLANFYLENDREDDAAGLLADMQTNPVVAENILYVNNILIELGSKLLKQKSYPRALLALQAVRRKAEILKMQKAALATLEARIKVLDQQLLQPGSTAPNPAPLKERVTKIKEILPKVEENVSYDPVVIYSIAQAFYEDKRHWEAILAFRTIYEDYKDFPDRSRALMGLIVCNGALRRVEKTMELCDQYFKEFPDAEEAGMVNNLALGVAMSIPDYDKAQELINRGVSIAGADKEQLLYTKANIIFSKNKREAYTEARTLFTDFQKEFSQSHYSEDVDYKIALCYFFENDYKNSLKSFKNYLDKNPKGSYRTDARYRLAVLDYAEAEAEKRKDNAPKAKELYLKLVDELNKTVTESPNDPMIGQVYSLMGDAYARLTEIADAKQPEENKSEDAIQAYIKSVKTTKADDVLAYSIEEATGRLINDDRWEDLAKMYQEFIQDRPKHPLVLKAANYIGMAKLRVGKTPEEKEASKKEALEFLAGYARGYIFEPSNDSVEPLIAQVAKILAPRKKPKKLAPAPVAAAATTASVTTNPDVVTVSADVTKPAEEAASAPAAATPAPAVEDPAVALINAETELVRILSPTPDQANATSEARLLYAKAELARLGRDSVKAQQYIEAIPTVCKAEDLSPYLLAMAGETIRKKGDIENAKNYFKRLVEFFPNSEYVDYAPVGLGDIEFADKKYADALQFYVDAIDKYAAASRLKDATAGKARCLYKLEKYAEAEKEWESIANTKEWRGELTAESLFMLGEIASKTAQTDPNARGRANGYYQRLYVGQQKYINWAAQGYLRSADMLDLDGKREEAIKTLREFRKNPKMKDQTELLDKARSKLGQMGVAN